MLFFARFLLGDKFLVQSNFDESGGKKVVHGTRFKLLNVGVYRGLHGCEHLAEAVVGYQKLVSGEKGGGDHSEFLV